MSEINWSSTKESRKPHVCSAVCFHLNTMNTPLTREQVLRLHAKAIALMESPPMGEQERRAADAVKCVQQIEDFLSAWRLQRETAPLFYEWYIAKVQVYRCSECSRLARRDRSHECLAGQDPAK